MKYLVILLAVVSFGLIFTGIYYDFIMPNEVLKNKFYGSGTLLLFIITMPLFLYYRRKKIDVKKYMINPPKEKEKN